MSERIVNLYSDTQTQPTAAMRRAMARAPVGDEQRGEDPSINALCARVADLLGMEAAVFMPSGTMCNEVALLVHCRPGDEVICDRTAHVREFEGGGPAALAGVLINPVAGEHGVYGPDELRGALRDGSRYRPRSALAVIEQTSNLGGGRVWPLESVRKVVRAAKRARLRLHMDGARLPNAVVASGVPAVRFLEGFDSGWIDLSKGLGCPVGAVLAGSRGFIEEAWRWKQRLGGAMRQAGILAAAGLHALDHHVERLADDHANARRFAELAAEVPGVRPHPAQIDTNIVFLDVSGTGVPGGEIVQRMGAHGVKVGSLAPGVLRAVTHLDVGRRDVERAARVLHEVIDETAGKRRGRRKSKAR